MRDNEYKEVDTDSYLAQSLYKEETALIQSYTELMFEKHALMKLKEETLQRLYKLEEDMSYLHRKIQEYQRIRLKAANAEAKPQPNLIKDLQNETGLSPEEISKALRLMRKKD